ncbi:23S rRNA (pseudouridine(1915)-N(3))-methyltransferase RlmH [Sulfoacidibacillus thermotolerans]|uniref:Ribosomal RNA large subunit methyltransferase H n=1 Tax=Sulfoacidibacillus thermotolerans TaxID=1765684 RepID=A0A2U3D9J4_SULT2|nr:23S rRNA (pseudouridine(1915)-N(3))-methyltransferase RlmH [Sulfoacidibacillus thermotolerans]PWI57933.1 23S rRNA (pseudouridine(1915)-N(3))-methyltransferase RlmH [Sulfoacidibacillus thermotolerans]
MQITVIAVGKLKEKYWKEAQAEYLKRLLPYASLSVLEVEDEADEGDPARIKKQEGARITAKLKERDFVIALEIQGVSCTSLQFAKKLQESFAQGFSRYVFVIGGSQGLDDAIVQRSHWRFSMSPLTFPHQMARIILLEQLYRGFRIVTGAPYHK